MDSPESRRSPITIFEDDNSDVDCEEFDSESLDNDALISRENGYHIGENEDEEDEGLDEDAAAEGETHDEEERNEDPLSDSVDEEEGEEEEVAEPMDEPVKSIEPTQSTHGYDGSFSTTAPVHLDDRRDPSLDYIEPATPTPDENVADPFSQSAVTAYSPNYDICPRKVSEAISTIEDELEYYRSPLPGRSPLAISTRQPASPYAHTPSKIMPYPPGHSRSNSAVRHDSRAVFRSPSSVRAIQLSSPPPFEPSPLSSRHKRHLTNGSQNGSVRGSSRVRQSNSPFVPHSNSGTPTRRVREKSAPRDALKAGQELPLVLLHCTLHLINVPAGYSLAALESVGASKRVKRDVALLRRKLDPSVLERGILVQHPGEDYELLEERVLESLELKKPKVGGCGHFRNTSQEWIHDEHEMRAEGEEIKVKCEDCARPFSNSMLDDDTQAKIRRWEIKVYAANGLMRAGAWSAAWREMEKVDVEVGIWLGAEDKDLGGRLEEWTRQQEALEDTNERHHGVMDQAESDFHDIAGTIRQAKRSADPPVSRAPISRPSTANSNSSRHKVPFSGTHTSVDPGKTRTTDIPPTDVPRRASTPPPAVPKNQQSSEIPLTTLLRNYFQRLLSRHQTSILPALVVILAFYLVAYNGLSTSPVTEIGKNTTAASDALPSTMEVATPVVETVTETVASTATPTAVVEAADTATCSCDCDELLAAQGLVALEKTELERLRALESVASEPIPVAAQDIKGDKSETMVDEDYARDGDLEMPEQPDVAETSPIETDALDAE